MESDESENEPIHAKRKPLPPVVESASDFSAAESDEDDSEGGGVFSDGSVGDFVPRCDVADDQMRRVARALPAERSAIHRTIEKHSRSGRLRKLEAFVKALADVAVRSGAPCKEDAEALRAILAAARGMDGRWRKDRYATP